MLVVEGSIPNEKIKPEGYWCGFGNNPETGQPMTTSEWLDRLAPKALAILAVGTCATYGGIHAMAGNPTGAMGVPDYLGWIVEVEGGHPDRLRARLPDPPGQPLRDHPLPALPGRGHRADDPARRGAAAQVALRQDGARGLRPRRLLRAGRVRHRVRLSPSAWSSSAAGARSSSATCPSAAGSTAWAAARTSAASASAARCRASRTSSMPFMDAPPGSLVSGAASKAVRRRHPPAPQDHREEARQGTAVAQAGAAS